MAIHPDIHIYQSPFRKGILNQQIWEDRGSNLHPFLTLFVWGRDGHPIFLRLLRQHFAQSFPIFDRKAERSGGCIPQSKRLLKIVFVLSCDLCRAMKNDLNLISKTKVILSQRCKSNIYFSVLSAFSISQMGSNILTPFCYIKSKARFMKNTSDDTRQEPQLVHVTGRPYAIQIRLIGIIISRLGRVSKCCANIPLYHIKMQRVNQSQSSQEIEMRDTQAVSPDSMAREEAPSAPLPAQRGYNCYWKQCTFLAMLIVCSLMFGYEINTQKTDRYGVIDNYDFMVFCPVTDEDFKADAPPNQELRRLLLTSGSFRIHINEEDKSNYLDERTFLVRTQSRVENNKLVLQYCGKMKFFEEDCKNRSQSKDRCTGSPMFDIPDRQSVDIIWVNNLDPNVPIDGSECLLPTDINKEHCTIMTKINPKNTFIDPTIHPQSSKTGQMRISKEFWPMSTHVHGAEIRPVFDGNPLSWNSNNQADKIFGTGTILSSQKCYYESFQQAPKLKTHPPRYRVFDPSDNEVFNFKVNRYPNQQNPGTLWYHDHAMRLTNFNVKSGLAGFYLLRDSELTKYLGIARQNEKLVLITSTNTSYDLAGLVANTVYRFRFLNGNYGGGSTMRYYFTYGQCDDIKNDKVPFTLIGADSSLFDYGIENQREFVLSNAERIDLLIKFDKNQRQFMICGSTDYNIGTNKESIHTDAGKETSSRNIRIPLKEYSAEQDLNAKESRITNINLTKWVSYTDFKKINDSQIAVKRMRPLLSTIRLTINGRQDFHAGKSENPVIGTVEDWFIINTMGMDHPIHIHLINFQVVKVYDLRLYEGSSSTKYELDFVAEGLKNAKSTPDGKVNQYKLNVFNGSSINYTYLSTYLTDIKKNAAVVDSLSNIYPENQKDSNRVSGLDLLARDEAGAYKYVTDGGSPSKKIEYSRWKDTAFAEKYKAFQFRVRWAKSSYDESKDKATGNFFHAPADELREYPGYVYHCHILNHEDNEMMRPIMLQLPDVTLSSSACNNLTWVEKSTCINGRCAGN